MGVGVLSFLIIWKTVRTCLFAMVFGEERGLIKLDKNVKRAKIKGCGATFTGFVRVWWGFCIGGAL